jgi:hypothetical protein
MSTSVSAHHSSHHIHHTTIKQPKGMLIMNFHILIICNTIITIYRTNQSDPATSYHYIPAQQGKSISKSTCTSGTPSSHHMTAHDQNNSAKPSTSYQHITSQQHGKSINIILPTSNSITLPYNNSSIATGQFNPQPVLLLHLQLHHITIRTAGQHGKSISKPSS